MAPLHEQASLPFAVLAVVQLAVPPLAALVLSRRNKNASNSDRDSSSSTRRRSVSASSLGSLSSSYSASFHASSSSHSLVLLLGLVCCAYAFHNAVFALSPLLHPLPHTPVPAPMPLRTLYLLSYLFTALATPLLIPIAYELCHTLHGGPKRRLLYHDQVGRIAAAACALGWLAYGLVDFFALSRVSDSLECGKVLLAVCEIPAGELLPATRAASTAGSAVLALAGGCLWRRTGTGTGSSWPWLTVSQLAVLLGRAVYQSEEPHSHHHLAQSVWDLLLTASLAFAVIHVVRNSSLSDDATTLIPDAHDVHQPLLLPASNAHHGHVHWHNYTYGGTSAFGGPPPAAASPGRCACTPPGDGTDAATPCCSLRRHNSNDYYSNDDEESESALVASRRELAKWTRATTTTTTAAANNTHNYDNTSPASLITNPKVTNLRTPPAVCLKERDEDGGDDGACSVAVVERDDSNQTIAEDG
ncbi:hypothetical protein HDU87_008754, partial [Geranomyces variabilis]